MKKGKRIISSILCLVLLCALTLPARAEAPEVNIVWLPEGVTPVDASLWSINGNTGNGIKTVDPVINQVREVKKGDLIAVRRDGEYGYMNINGELVVPFISTHIALNEEYYFFYSDGLLPILQRDENGQISTRYVDKTGETVIELEEGFAGFAFQNGVALVEGQDSWGEIKYGAIDTKGNVVVPYEYDRRNNNNSSLGFYNDFVVLGKKNSEGETDYFCVSSDGKTVLSVSDYGFFLLSPMIFSEGLAFGTKDGQSGFFDTKGNLKFTWEDSSGFFYNGFALVHNRDGKFGYIDTSGRELTPMEFDFAENFTIGGFARVTLNGERYYIDRTGQRAVPPYVVPETVLEKLSSEGYEADSSIVGDRIRITKDGKTGYADQNGDVVIPPEYDSGPVWFTSGLALVSKDEKYGYINTQGEIVVPLESEKSSYIGLIMGGYVGVVYKDGRYGIFENPYYKEPSTSSSPGLLSGGGSGNSASAGGGSFPILPVAGALAVVVAGGGVLLVLKKKKS